MKALTRRAFEEDKVVIEAQQRVLDETSERPILATVHDRGSTIYNRLIKRRVMEEQRGISQHEFAVP
jgi:vanillate O-demethylase monooxygenase subunit